MKRLLQVCFGVNFVWMVVTTLQAGFTINLFDAWPSYSANPWAMATLYDAYFGFLTIFAWVAYRETSWLSRVAWFGLFMGLGTIATSLYILIQLTRLGNGEPVARILEASTRSR